MSGLRETAPAAFLMVVALGCGPAARDGDPVDPRVDASTAAYADAPSCGEQTVPIEVRNLGAPPDLLIVLDRSSSMAGPIVTFPPNFTPAWTIMRDALNLLAGARQDNIRFGLLEFPSDNLCGVGDGAVRVPVDTAQAPEITAYFQARSPEGNTPAHLGLAAALAYYGSIPVNPEGRYVLFATDGQPNCGGGMPEVDSAADTVAAVRSLATAGIKTFVLGFGSSFTGGDQVLRESAQAGLVPRAGAKPYYEARDAASLNAAFGEIAGGIIVPSCSYALASAPPDPQQVTVLLGDQAVPRSTQHTNGWDYHPDPGTITFFGSYCQQLQSGSVSAVSFRYGCPGPEVD